MKKNTEFNKRIIIGVVFVLLLAGRLTASSEVPPLKGRVNDYAGIMESEDEKEAERYLA
ncbi:MAG: hypothetical protein HUK25_02610, partial [Treponema sp.]|nr:hypothetical protein [Treponema sp.]